MTTAIVAALFAAIFAGDFLPLRKSMPLLEKTVYIALMLISLCVLILYTLDILVPSPSTLIIQLTESLVPAVKK